MSELPETNSGEARRWLAQAGEDLLTAERIADNPDLAQRIGCFLAHLAAEKAMKACLISRSQPFRKVHDLRELRELLPAEVQAKIDAQDLDVLNPWTIEGRYPADVPDATAADASECLDAARRVIHAVRAAIDDSDHS